MQLTGRAGESDMIHCVITEEERRGALCPLRAHSGAISAKALIKSSVL
jgi:hypothetical protein